MNQLAPNTKPQSWTPEEDAQFVGILEREILQNGKKLEEVYPIAAQELGRPEGGCKYRYTNVIRKTLTGELKKKLVDNSPRANVTPINAQAQNSRSKIILRLQQVDKELTKIDKDIEEAEKKVAALKLRKTELGNDMQRYTEMLVKSALGEEGESA